MPTVIPRIAVPLLAALLPTTLVAQVVSPARYATTQGNRLKNAPFGGYRQYRYQQVHGDLRGSLLPITGFTFRLGVPTVQSTPRTVEAELMIGESDFSRRSSVFAANFTATPIRAISRKRLALPDWTNSPTAYPAPFDARLNFDAPWIYTGLTDLAWSITVYDNSTASGPIANTYLADGFRDDFIRSASGTELGTGCMAPGRFVVSRGALTLISSWLPTPQITVAPGFNWGVRSARGIALLGTFDPQLKLPSFCTELRVGGVFAQTTGPTDFFGGYQGTPFVVPFLPQYVGLQLFAQGASFDPGRQPPVITLSSGRTTAVPALPPPPSQVASVFASNTTTAPSGTLAQFEGIIVEIR